ncbi:hypothetical protein RHGRI_010888 [Rhododendron griersonianum]|uniref:Uncharacterized protein n=1 Tax=Rhododendron griersonianum TaxID=479676 RepID=A0AAV6KK65_9ERIC|nr:hypothetical protein RHGRI_010888 [Rhododendron griersonianum]
MEFTAQVKKTPIPTKSTTTHMPLLLDRACHYTGTFFDCYRRVIFSRVFEAKRPIIARRSISLPDRVMLCLAGPGHFGLFSKHYRRVVFQRATKAKRPRIARGVSIATCHGTRHRVATASPRVGYHPPPPPIVAKLAFALVAGRNMTMSEQS